MKVILFLFTAALVNVQEQQGSLLEGHTKKQNLQAVFC